MLVPTCQLFVLFCHIIDKIFSNVSQWIAGRGEMSESREEISSEDGDKDYTDDGDSQDVQISSITIPEPSSAAKSMSSLNSQEDATLMSTTNLRPSSSSKSQVLTYGAQPVLSSSQPDIEIIEEGRGTGSSPKVEQADNWDDKEFLKKQDEVEGRLKEISEDTRLAEEHVKRALASIRWDSEVSEDCIE